jgi:hypothetical protein
MTIKDFIEQWDNIIIEKRYSHEQIFNMDEIFKLDIV